MPRAQSVVTSLLGALTLGCLANNTNPGDDTQAAATSTTSTTSGSQSGSVTSAPGSATDGGSDSAPTTATSTTTGPDSTGNPWTCGFLECMDMPTDLEDCDQWAQDCPEGQKCAAVSTDGGGALNGWRCVDVIGTDEPGQPCTADDIASGVDSCIKGAMCWGVDMEGDGTCVALCTGTPDAAVCENKGMCSSSEPLSLCLPSCDLLLQDCPAPADACYPFNDGAACVPDASGDEGQANDPCEFINVCEPGLMCAEPAVVGMGCPDGSFGCCTPFCKFPDGACPNPDQQCVQYFDPMQLRPNDPWLDIGYCGVPG
jgi:hypothetical protein